LNSTSRLRRIFSPTSFAMKTQVLQSGMLALEVRENIKFLVFLAEADALDEPEMQNGQTALGVLDPIEYIVDFLDHFWIHGVLPPGREVIIL